MQAAGQPPPAAGGHLHRHRLCCGPAHTQLHRRVQVVHLRNLPFDVTIEEIRDFCAPWGTIVAVKDKVGGNKNQAFVEFATLEQAISIVTRYQHSPEPAKFRGRPSWLSFSGRDKLTNVQPGTDAPTPVLQVSVNNIMVRGEWAWLCRAHVLGLQKRGSLLTISSLPCQVVPPAWGPRAGCPLVHCLWTHQRPAPTWPAPSWRHSLRRPAPTCCLLPSAPLNVQPDMAQAVNLDLLTQLFNAYGYVKKMVTFNKPEGGMLAWVQFPDAQTAAHVSGACACCAVQVAMFFPATEPSAA